MQFINHLFENVAVLANENSRSVYRNTAHWLALTLPVLLLRLTQSTMFVTISYFMGSFSAGGAN
jgi:hypothetical protein